MGDDESKTPRAFRHPARWCGRQRLEEECLFTEREEDIDTLQCLPEPQQNLFKGEAGKDGKRFSQTTSLLAGVLQESAAAVSFSTLQDVISTDEPPAKAPRISALLASLPE